MADNIILRFIGEDEVSKVADDVSDSIDGVAKAADNSGSAFDSLKEIGVGALRSIGEIALEVGKAGLEKIGDFLSSSIEEATGWQNALAQTEAVVKSTGMSAGLTAEYMATLAGNMSAASGASVFSDDAILGAQNVLATFTQIKGVNFRAGTQAVLDLSQALGQDLQSSAIQVGKALNDPLFGLGALSRSGIQFTDEQKDLVASLMETGDVAGAQAVILKELSTQFGGSAAAATKTATGQFTIFNERLADIKQSLGDAVIPILVQFTDIATEYVLPMFGDMIDSVNTLLNQFGESESIITSLQNIRSTLTQFTSTNELMQRMGALIEQVGITAGAMFQTLVNYAQDPTVQRYFQYTIDLLQQLAVLVVDILVVALQALAWAFDIVMIAVAKTLEDFAPLIDYVIPKVIDILKALSHLLRGEFSESWLVIKNLLLSIWNDISTAVINYINDLITRLTNFVTTIATTAIQLGTDIVNGIATGITKAKDAVIGALKKVLQDSINGVKVFLGIASPSKLMAALVGQPIADGIAQGILSGMTGIQTAMTVATVTPNAITQQRTQNFYLTANYATVQSESSLRNDIQGLQLLARGL